jgi:hypothetical protein
MCPEDRTIVARVTQQQDQSIATKITLLGSDPPEECLHVGDAGLCLDHDLQARRRSLDHPIGGSEVTREWHQYLQDQAKPVSQASAEPFDQGEMRCVSERRPLGIEADLRV